MESTTVETDRKITACISDNNDNSTADVDSVLVSLPCKRSVINSEDPCIDDIEKEFQKIKKLAASSETIGSSTSVSCADTIESNDDNDYENGSSHDEYDVASICKKPAAIKYLSSSTKREPRVGQDYQAVIE